MPTRRALPVLLWAMLAGAALAAVPPELSAPELSPDVQRGMAMGRRVGLDVPPVPPSIYLETAAAHHTQFERIVIAWRGADGRWRYASAAEETSGLVTMEPQVTLAKTRLLSVENSRALDSLLANRGLYRQTGRLKPRGVGDAFHVLEVVSPKGHLVLGWSGYRLGGKAGWIADLLIGHD